jgi:hypothetical protein
MMSGAAALLAVAALSASPERVTVTGSAAAPLELTNHGAAPLVVEARPGGVVLDLRGRPRLVSGAGPARWLSVRPRLVSLAPGATARLAVASSPPRRARPGDHHAVVLLTTRPVRGAAVAVRMRLGVRIVVRIPGRIVRRLELRGVGIRRGGILDVSVANLGNVTERLRLTVTLLRRGRRVAVLRAAARELLPRTRALVGLRHPKRLRGRVTAIVELRGPPLIRRAFQLRL